MNQALGHASIFDGADCAKLYLRIDDLTTWSSGIRDSLAGLDKWERVLITAFRAPGEFVLNGDGLKPLNKVRQ